MLMIDELLKFCKTNQQKHNNITLYLEHNIQYKAQLTSARTCEQTLIVLCTVGGEIYANETNKPWPPECNRSAHSSLPATIDLAPVMRTPAM